VSQFHPDAWVTVVVLFGILVLLVTTSLPAILLMLGGLTILLLTGVLSVSQAFAGFANDGNADGRGAVHRGDRAARDGRRRLDRGTASSASPRRSRARSCA